MAPVDEQGQGLVGVAGDHFDHRPGLDAEAVEIFEEAAVTFEDADDGGLATGGEFVEGNEAAAVAILFGLQSDGEAVRTILLLA